jgi:hypothetical protein
MNFVHIRLGGIIPGYHSAISISKRFKDFIKIYCYLIGMFIYQ